MKALRNTIFWSGLFLGMVAIVPLANSETSPVANPIPGVAGKPVKPYRTFITIQRYNVEQTGDKNNPIANVQLELLFPSGAKTPLPAPNQFWPIGQGQVQEINQTFELPWAYIKNDGFTFVVQMIRKGTKILPCQIDVQQLSQFNRAYICRTDINYQANIEKLKDESIDKEAVQVRVFTDMNLQPKEKLPSEIALVR